MNERERRLKLRITPGVGEGEEVEIDADAYSGSSTHQAIRRIIEDHVGDPGRRSDLLEILGDRCVIELDETFIRPGTDWLETANQMLAREGEVELAIARSHEGGGGTAGRG